MGKHKHIDAEVNGERKIQLSEIGNHEVGIEPVADRINLELEAFMNERVHIIIHDSGVDGTLEVETPSVNGVNMPIVRGVETKVRRKFVEALARARTTSVKQSSYDPYRPDHRPLVEKTSLTYPFTVTRDPNPKGSAWLKGILAER